MLQTKIWPTVIMLESIGASICYALEGNWRQGLYWLAGAVITFSVTF